jgi:two-component system alkaline phosphatase synthesis response regulator PhoP/two-component system response regulator VicR
VPVGVCVADFRRHQLLRDGIPQEISAKELDLLRYLAQHRGEVVSRESLLTQVWGHQREVETRTIDNFIVRLRKKIEADPASPRFLITIHGSGYKLVEQ